MEDTPDSELLRLTKNADNHDAESLDDQFELAKFTGELWGHCVPNVLSFL